MSTIPHPAPSRLAWPSLLGEDPVVRTQTSAVLFSSATYVFYGVISAVQVGTGLQDLRMALWLAVAAVLANTLFYVVVRSGRAATGIDPGLGRTQLVIGILFMYPTYASIGPAAGGLLVVMCSHVVYCMFGMTPRQVWQLVAWLLGGLVLTMAACVHFWPERHAWNVQLSNLLYALLVMPLIALLAYRVTAMTTTLKKQHADLEAAMGKLKELATRDELTRTHNRRHMNELLRIQQAHHKRHGQPLSLALIDIDLFKSVNDRHGHAVGDEVLRGFAQVAQSQMRTADLLGRWGGEEFLVVMPNTTRADALVALNRLQERLAEVATSVMPQGLKITFSAGVTAVEPEERLDAAIERADQAMYRAKSRGRARCVEI